MTEVGAVGIDPETRGFRLHGVRADGSAASNVSNRPYMPKRP